MPPPNYPDPMDILTDALRQASEFRLDASATGMSVRDKIHLAIAHGFDDPNFTVEDAALTAGVSSRRVRQILAEGSPGTTLRAEVTKRRMIKARQLLIGSTYTIAHIAYLCGFKDASSFAAAFRVGRGATPKTWRMHYGGAKRAGGTTGCFRKASDRARTKRQGEPLPSMSRETLSEGDRAVLNTKSATPCAGRGSAARSPSRSASLRWRRCGGRAWNERSAYTGRVHRDGERPARRLRHRLHARAPRRPLASRAESTDSL